jgi:hypothetical protein
MIVNCRHYCPQCEQPRPFRRRVVNRKLHLRLTILTVGLWAPVWVVLALRKPRPWRCSFCWSTARRAERKPRVRAVTALSDHPAH